MVTRRSRTISAVAGTSGGGSATAIRRIRRPITGIASASGTRESGCPPSSRSSSEAPVSGSAASRRTVPRPSQNRSARTSARVRASGGVRRNASGRSPRRTGTTSAFEPCIGAPSSARSQRAHISATSSGSAASHASPSCHQRGIARYAPGSTIRPVTIRPAPGSSRRESRTPWSSRSAGPSPRRATRPPRCRNPCSRSGASCRWHRS